MITKFIKTMFKKNLDIKTTEVNQEYLSKNKPYQDSTILGNLNSEQLAAVTNTEGYVCVIAGAGSGKTRALTHRFAYLVNDLGISANKIMSVTFTNKAAGEMKSRIRRLIGDQDTAFINTFHGFCVRVLREDIHKINYPKQFIIMDEEDQKSILSEIYESLGITISDITYKVALQKIADLKMTNSYVKYTTNPDLSELNLLISNATLLLDKIIYNYLLLQRKNYLLDFDDLIEFVLFTFENHTDILEKWQFRLEYIQVDEFQDVNNRQFYLVNLLSKIHKNLFVVGDPDQTIYSWRGARVDIIINFADLFQNTKTVFLNTNYRSTPEVLNVSNSLIKHNQTRIEKELIPVNINGVKVMHYHAKNTFDEAEWIVKKIKSLNVKFSDIAILYRAHYVSRNIEESLINHEIGYVIHSGISFYQRKEIKDVLSYLRLIISGDDISFLRVINTPKRGIGNKRIQVLKEYAQKGNISLYESLIKCIDNKIFDSTGAKEFLKNTDRIKNIYINEFHKVDVNNGYRSIKIIDIIDDILKSTGYEKMLMTEADQERLDNVAELKNSILSYENNAGEKIEIEDYLAKVALFTSGDNQGDEGKVKLMTIHTAKGLEFPIVFVCGLNEGVFPSVRVKTKNDMEEERRLAYVAFTRAERMLYITDSEGFRHDGGARYPSRFIFNIQDDLLDREGSIDKDIVLRAQSEILLSERIINSGQNTKFNVGDLVKHISFGDGVIINSTEDHYEIKFNQFSTNRHIKKDFIGLNIKNN